MAEHTSTFLQISSSKCLSKHHASCVVPIHREGVSRGVPENKPPTQLLGVVWERTMQ